MELKVIAIILIGMIAITAFSGCTQPTACTEEAKICPDGSAVGRTGPNCEFAQCPATGSGADSGSIPMPTDTGEDGAPPELPL
jgi:hypothetical protein